jgi:hypothetical protein
MTELVFQFEPYDPTEKASYATHTTDKDIDVIEDAAFTTVQTNNGAKIQFTDTGNLRYVLEDPSFADIENLFEAAKEELSEYIRSDISKFDVSFLLSSENAAGSYIEFGNKLEEFISVSLSGDPRYVELSEKTVMISPGGRSQPVMIA